jgi:two-component system NtrC family sensor kinase
MKMSTKTKLGLIFLVIACLIGVVTSVIVNFVVATQIVFEAQERVNEHLSSARWVYDSRIRDVDQPIRWTSIRDVVRKAVKKGDVSSIRGELTGLMVQEKLDFLTLVDRDGTVMFRFNNPDVSGDSLAKDPFVKKALVRKSISGTQVLSREELAKEGEDLARKATFTLVPVPKAKPTEKMEETSGMVLKSARPIVDLNGDVLGVLMGGILVNRNYEVVDQIKNIVFKDARYKAKEIGTATIFLGDLRISTNVMDKEGSRALGTRAMKEVQEQTLERGIPWIQRAFVVDGWYITAYEPIRDVEDKIVGMLYVGMLENKYADIKEKLILFFFLFSMSGMLIALTVSFLLSWRIMKKYLAPPSA